MFYYIFKYTWLQLPVIKTLQHVKSWIYMILFNNHFNKPWASLVARRLKRLPAIRETWVQSLGQEDPLEKEMATHSSILDWRIPWTEEPGGLYSSWGRKESDTTSLSLLLSISLVKKTPLSPLQREGKADIQRNINVHSAGDSVEEWRFTCNSHQFNENANNQNISVFSEVEVGSSRDSFQSKDKCPKQYIVYTSGILHYEA